MSNLKKTQADIERALRKVYEGIGYFSELWEKIKESEGYQKEKYESELKKEIKKLQRHRDSIKNWASLSEIEDKTQLWKARKDIEKDMERFRAYEKEKKAEASSKEGLNQPQKLDPQQAARREMETWIAHVTSKLTEQLEEVEMDLEAYQGTHIKRDRNEGDEEKVSHLKELANRHRHHLERLEQMLKLLTTETLKASEMSGAKDFVDDYLARHKENFDDYSNVDACYAEILHHLDAIEGLEAAEGPMFGNVQV